MANKDRLISVEKTVRELQNEIYWNDSTKAAIRAFLRTVPAADAEEVVHGHWVKHNFLGHEQYACSECQTLGLPQWKRCPVCEAKMDGERKDNDS